MMFFYRDLRESNVVTKVFNVEYAEPESDNGSSSSDDSEVEGVDNGTNFQFEMNSDSNRKVRNWKSMFPNMGRFTFKCNK